MYVVGGGGVGWDNNTRIYFKRLTITTKKNNLQKTLHLHFFLFSFLQQNCVVLSYGDVWSIVMHIHLAEENLLGKLQCTVI